jgi:aminoglycoside 6'-N-acetyltransferase
VGTKVDGGVFRFERLTRADFGRLAAWLAEPHVARWWHHEFTPEAVERDFGPTVDGVETSLDHVALLDGRPIGFVQFCLFEDYPEYVDEMASVYPVESGAASIDYFIGEPHLVGHGVGRRMISAFVEHAWGLDDRATHLVVPVNTDNVASWKALEHAGFRLVASGDLAPDNPADDPAHVIFRLDRPK